MQKITFPSKPKKIRTVYMDAAAGTKADAAVVRTMMPFFIESFANPSAPYSLGLKNKTAISLARKTVADILGAHSDSIVFTSGGTEANNLAIFGLLKGLGESKKKIHIITTAVEHHSVLEPLRMLEKQGIEITYMPVNSRGEIRVRDCIALIRPETKLISVMYANNEIGTVNSIAEIGREILKYRQRNKTQFPYFHVDACQAAGSCDVNTERLHADLMTVNGSKIYGPKGTGVLFIRRGVPVKPIILGGGQESGLRSGTENVPCIVGIAKALELITSDFEKKTNARAEIRDYFWKKIKEKIPDVFLNGPELSASRLANNLNIRFPGLEGETLILYLDAYGIIAATGSACASDYGQGSHVLVACGLSADEARSSVRFTLDRSIAKNDIDYVMKFLPGIVNGVREMFRSAGQKENKIWRS